MKSALTRTLSLLMCLALFMPLYGWWDEGHMIVNRAAALNVPRAMPAFFRAATGRLTYLGPEPDRWKTGGATLYDAESPEHYINLEMLNNVGELPVRRFDYYKKIAAKK